MEPLPNTFSLTMLQSSGTFAQHFFSYHAPKQWNLCPTLFLLTCSKAVEPLPNTCSLTMLQSNGTFAQHFFSYHAPKQWNLCPTLFLLPCSKAVEFSLFWHPSHSILPCLQNCIKNSSYTQYHKWFKIPSSYFCPPPPHKWRNSCWNSVEESFVKACYVARTWHAYQVTAEVLHILQQSAFLSYMCSLSLIMLSALNSDKHRVETEQPQFKYWALVLGFQLCVLQLVRPVSCGDYHPWNVQLNVYPGILLGTLWTIRCQTLSSLGFFCHGAFVVWKPNRGKGVVTFVDYLSQCRESCYEQIRCTCKQSVQRKMQMFQGSLLCTALCICDLAGFLDWKGAALLMK